MPSVLFVCTANQYRSPLAAAYFRRELETHGAPRHWTVESAGTWARAGAPAAPQAQQAAREAGLNLDGHFARQVDLELLGRFDLILAMEAGQVEAIQVEFPAVARRIHLLSAAVGRAAYDIPDPFLSKEDARQVAAEIQALLQGGFERLTSLAAQLHADATEA